MEKGPALWKVLLIILVNLYISVQLSRIIFMFLLGANQDPLLWADGSVTW